MRPAQLKLPLWILTACLQAHLALAAFSMPTVDVQSPEIGTNTSIAFWSYTDTSISAGNYISIVFPPGTSLTTRALNSTDAWVTMKYTYTGSGSGEPFTPQEVTITSGLIDANGLIANLALPGAMDVGKFYVRFRPSAGVYQPGVTGTTQAWMVDPWGNTVVTRTYAATTSSAAPQAKVSGKVSHLNGQAATAVAVLVSSDGNNGMHPSVAGPRSLTQSSAGPRGTSSNAYTTFTSYDGAYSFSLPIGTWTFMAACDRVTRVAGALVKQSVQTTPTTQNISVDSTLNFVLPNWP